MTSWFTKSVSIAKTNHEIVKAKILLHSNKLMFNHFWKVGSPYMNVKLRHKHVKIRQEMVTKNLTYEYEAT